jgi:Tfp pilus assembly protein PilF
VIVESILCLALSSAARQEMPTPEAPIVGNCASDPDTLLAEARGLLRDPTPDPDALRRSRDLLRRARKTSPGAGVDLLAADLAFAAGDEEEGADLLAAAAEKDARRLSIPELLLLARRAEARRRWREAVARYQDLARALERDDLSRALEGASRADWIAPRLRELELEARADGIAPPAAGPPVEARLALADGKRALAAGRLQEARERLRAALDLAPDYAEALLALGAVETRAGRRAAAIRAYRGALAAEPDRLEALTALATLLWEEPDRRAKEESLRLLDRASAQRPDLRGLLRLSAARWAEFGDAPRALERLDRFLSHASPQERADAAELRDALSRRVRGAAEEPTPAAAAPEEPAPEGPSATAVDLWRKAQVHLERGGPDADAEAIRLLRESERLDPALAAAPELLASIHLRRGEWREAEDALRRSIRADPSRVASYEQLARLLDRFSNRSAEALDAWRKAETAGSTEALIVLARDAERAGSRREALRLYRRYGDEAPAGADAAEAAAAAARLAAREREITLAAAAIAAVALAVAVGIVWRRRFGLTLAEWLARDPGRAQDARPVVGRLRHEVLKHGGMLLSDAAARLSVAEGDAEARRATATLLSARLYGEGGARGLLAEADASIAELEGLARASGARLNLRHRDPDFAWLLRGLDVLRGARRSLRRIAEDPTRSRDAARAARRLRRAASWLALSSGPEIARTVERAAVLPVRADALRALLAGVAHELDATAPPLEPLGGLASEGALPCVRIAAGDWETVWRNLFGNALEEARRRSSGSLRLGLAAERRRDPVTGEARLRLVLADDLEGGIHSALMRERASERGLGIVVELLRRSDGSIEVVPPPAAGFTKGIAVELPAVEASA